VLGGASASLPGPAEARGEKRGREHEASDPRARPQSVKQARSEIGGFPVNAVRDAASGHREVFRCLFHAREWITDDVIDFAVEQDLAVGSPDVQFVPASVVRTLAHDGDASLPARTANIVLLPLSVDNVHWSLLVYDASRQLCVHYDSLGSNRDAAVALTEILTRRGFFAGISDFHEPQGLRQTDDYNCGMFVIELMERIAQAGTSTLDDGYLEQALSSDICNQRRDALLAALLDVAQIVVLPRSVQHDRRSSQRRWTVNLGHLIARYYPLLAAPGRSQAWHRAYLEFEAGGTLKLPVFDAFIAKYEPLYRRYHARKSQITSTLGFPVKHERRATWPSLTHSSPEARRRKRQFNRKARYATVPLAPDRLGLELGNEAAMFDAMITLVLVRKAFAARYPQGLERQGVAHMFWLDGKYGRIVARNAKNSEGNGTTRMLLPFSDTEFFDATYSQLHWVLRRIMEVTGASDATIARALLFLVFGGVEPDIDWNATVEIAPGAVKVETWKEIEPNLYAGSDAAPRPGAGKDLSGLQEVTDKTAYSLCAGHLLSFVVSVLFLAETRHTHAFWIGNRCILRLVSRGCLTLQALFTDIDDEAHSGNLIPSYQFKPNFKTHAALYAAAKQRLALTSILGYYSDGSTDDSFRDVRNAIAQPPGDETETTKLFTANKLLFAWLLDQLSAYDSADVQRDSGVRQELPGPSGAPHRPVSSSGERDLRRSPRASPPLPPLSLPLSRPTPLRRSPPTPPPLRRSPPPAPPPQRPSRSSSSSSRFPSLPPLLPRQQASPIGGRRAPPPVPPLRGLPQRQLPPVVPGRALPGSRAPIPPCPLGHTNVIADLFVAGKHYCHDCRRRFP
jgi:Ulp1 protease family, C-terminal catalytic domain